MMRCGWWRQRREEAHRTHPVDTAHKVVVLVKSDRRQAQASQLCERPLCRDIRCMACAERKAERTGIRVGAWGMGETDPSGPRR